MNKSTSSSVPIWLTITNRSTHCGRRRVIRRLIEWDTNTKRLLCIYPPDYRRGIPRDEQLAGRDYVRPHQLDPNPISQAEFIAACVKGGVFAPGVQLT